MPAFLEAALKHEASKKGFKKGHTVNNGRIPWNKIPRPDPVYRCLPAREEVIWAAGFWEGEGSLSTRSVSASQVNPWPLERLRDNFGGSLNVRPAKGRQSACWQWTICGDQGRAFVALIYPHVSPRRQLQIENRFITQGKRIRSRSSAPAKARALALLRGRNLEGRFNDAKILGAKTKEGIRVQ